MASRCIVLHKTIWTGHDEPGNKAKRYQMARINWMIRVRRDQSGTPSSRTSTTLAAGIGYLSTQAWGKAEVGSTSLP